METLNTISTKTYPSAKEDATPEALRIANDIKEALRDVKEGKVYSFDSIDDALYFLTH
jgi:hypothetical protein